MVLITSFAFKGMVGLGTYFVFSTVLGWSFRNRLVQSPVYLIVMLVVVIIFLPIILAFQIWAYNLFKGKVTAEDLAYDEAY